MVRYVVLLMLLVGCSSHLENELLNVEDVNTDNSSLRLAAQNLDIPWELEFLPDGDLLVTERPGRLMRIGDNNTAIPVQGVYHRGEGGLLGLALHPDFRSNQLIYLYLTAQQDGAISNRVERYRLLDNTLTERTIILDNIPGASVHDGGRIHFGPDGYLYIGTGDATDEQLSQNINSLAGKILRIDEDGNIPQDNPFGNAVYSYGHRNVQGFTWDNEGQLWATEHGRSGLASGYDELNLIEKGKNYGWPDFQGDQANAQTVAPVLHSGASTTWAPSGAAHYNGSIYFAGLKGIALYQYNIESQQLSAHFRGEFGRLRHVKIHNNQLYILTSNTDGRGNPFDDDDRILMISLAHNSR